MLLVTMDTIKILIAAVKAANTSPIELLVDIIYFNRFLVLGICHRVLRVLKPIHYAAVFFNPGMGHIPEINKFIPYGTG